MSLYYQKWKSPLGNLHLVASDECLLVVAFDANWSDHKWRIEAGAERDTNAVIEKAKKQLVEYCEGKRREFDLPLELDGTNFQSAAWKALRKIPFGETRSYGEQAKTIRRPKAVRAIGLANSQNPISVIVPCHRVIGKSGGLTGYAGGLKNKKRLLEIEGLGA
ncbi:MAG: methylated-DNA--[protein]-cysteine S-methyltransferase [Bdellovibrionia bacterium]